jgi:hypothetical protein
VNHYGPPHRPPEHYGQPQPPHPYGPQSPGPPPAPVSRARDVAGVLGLAVGVTADIAVLLWPPPNVIPVGLGLLAIVLSAFRLSKPRVGREKYRNVARAGMTLGLVAVGCVFLFSLIADIVADNLSR